MIYKKTLLAAMMLIPLSTLYVYAVPLPGTITVDIDGIPHDISYEGDGVDVVGVEANMDDMSLIFEVQVSDPGLLRIDFERSFFDATFEGSDDEFFVIADGDFADIDETQTTSILRTLLIQLESGTEEIEIFGTTLAGSTFGGPVVEEPPEVEEPPVVEEPPEVEEPPVVEEPPEVEEPPVVEEKPKTECGPGTVLKDGVCVLDKTCGPGTHLEDGVCVLDTTGGLTTDRSLGTEFMIGIMVTLVIAFIVMILLYLIGRGSRRKTTV